MLRGHQADERHQLLGGGEAVEVADLGHQCERCQRFDPAQTTQPSDQPTPRLLLSGLADRTLQLLDPRVDEVDRMHVAVEGDLLGRKLEALLAEPLAPHHRPRARRQHAPLPQTELREPMPVAHPIKTRVLTPTHEIAGRLQLA